MTIYPSESPFRGQFDTFAVSKIWGPIETMWGVIWGAPMILKVGCAQVSRARA